MLSPEEKAIKLRKAKEKLEQDKIRIMQGEFKGKVESTYKSLNKYVVDTVKQDDRFSVLDEISFEVAKDVVLIETLCGVKFYGEELQNVVNELKMAKITLVEQGQTDFRNSIVTRVLDQKIDEEIAKEQAFSEGVKNFTNRLKSDKQCAWEQFSDYVKPLLNYSCSEGSVNQIIIAKKLALADDRFSLKIKMFKSGKVCITYLKLMEIFLDITLDKDDIKKFMEVMCPKKDNDFYISRLKDCFEYAYDKYKNDYENAELVVQKNKYIKFRAGCITCCQMEYGDLIDLTDPQNKPSTKDKNIFR